MCTRIRRRYIPLCSAPLSFLRISSLSYLYRLSTERQDVSFPYSARSASRAVCIAFLPFRLRIHIGNISARLSPLRIGYTVSVSRRVYSRIPLSSLRRISLLSSFYSAIPLLTLYFRHNQNKNILLLLSSRSCPATR